MSRIGTSTTLTAILRHEGPLWVAQCAELDVTSQGRSVATATRNLKEAVTLFLECADDRELRRRLRREVVITRFEAARA